MIIFKSFLTSFELRVNIWAAWTVVKNDLCLKPNHENQVNLVQIPDTLCLYHTLPCRVSPFTAPNLLFLSRCAVYFFYVCCQFVLLTFTYFWECFMCNLLIEAHFLGLYKIFFIFELKNVENHCIKRWRSIAYRDSKKSKDRTMSI